MVAHLSHPVTPLNETRVTRCRVRASLRCIPPVQCRDRIHEPWPYPEACQSLFSEITTSQFPHLFVEGAGAALWTPPQAPRLDPLPLLTVSNGQHLRPEPLSFILFPCKLSNEKLPILPPFMRMLLLQCCTGCSSR
jgi:hypothetical protein